MGSQLYPIREVAKITGVNSITLRAWQRRYGLIKPERTPKGHRLYSEADINTIRTILQWLDKGIAISQVKPLLTNPLHHDEQAAVSYDWQPTINKLIESVIQFNNKALDTLLNQLFADYPLNTVMTNLLLPLLDKLNERWQQENSTLIECDWLASYCQVKFGSRLYHHNQHSNPQKIIFIHLDSNPLSTIHFWLLSNALTKNHQMIVPLTTLENIVALSRIAQQQEIQAIVYFSHHELDKVLKQNLRELCKKLHVPQLLLTQHDDLERIKLANVSMSVMHPWRDDMSEQLGKFTEIGQ